MRSTDRCPYVLPSRVRDQPRVTPRQYARIVRGWIERAGLDNSALARIKYAVPRRLRSLRKTSNLRAPQLLLGHTKIESIVRYLGIEVDDALTLSEQVEL